MHVIKKSQNCFFLTKFYEKQQNLRFFCDFWKIKEILMAKRLLLYNYQISNHLIWKKISIPPFGLINTLVCMFLK
ncbi:hypothetical protein BpHYR1_010657 [Brachionus plicatilis]|uniref:Uncharacterized protein n=1 Tax=Brachionus plicatilis TaxID=10195 RepID=A0A3M7SLZ5_BRAPC|nr:hypothetical protein BpHYR1_010657 [Brachionus plicatilis]